MYGKRKMKDIMEINRARISIGLDSLENKKRNCMRCKKLFSTFENRLCSNCHEYIDNYKPDAEIHQEYKLYKADVEHYLYGANVK